ncbi:MAG: IS110 family transposase [Deltaproteobacteria bacterium]|nr:IS110 family transposase [Deltaproteobacteria bacterium]
MDCTLFGLDLAKRVFQLHWVDMETGEISRRQLKRQQVAEFFANRASGIIAMEACGSAHYWGRKLAAMGHEVRLIAGQFVRPFVKSNKTDVADAQAIWEAAQRPGMKFVALKTEEQQSVLTLHRIREQLVKIRTMQINQLRGLLYEFGADLPQGRHRGMARVEEALARLEGRLSPLVIDAIRDQLRRIETLDRDIAGIEKKLLLWKKQDESSRKLMEIPGVGLLTATAAVATMGDARVFKSGREFAAFLGLVPRQSGTGGRVKLLGISKRGDVYLRTLLIHGARSVIQHQKEHSPWLAELLSRRHRNAVVVALANKMARTIWALLAHDRTYDRNYAASAE